MGVSHNFDLPKLPAMPERKYNTIPESQLTRRKLQGLLHIMTAEIKARGTKTPHIFLPFRSRIDDKKLTLFLRRMFPSGVMVDTSQKAIIKSILDDFDEFTLICGLKYLWCRLPNNEIIGWQVYLEFKRKEHEAGYPKDAFLTIMPKCLSSSSHASIVYDFLDLMISIASNSQYNHLNGRKIAKMASIWAFKSTPASSSAFYDATLEKESSFLDGLESWKSTCNGLFHLLLSFLRAMLPDTEAETLNLPKTLQSLLVSNSYPPPEIGSTVKSVITIPCVHVRSTRRSSDPYELLSKVRHSLSFQKKDSFLSIENYTILKNIFQKSSTAEIVSTLSEESRRVLTRLTAEPVPSEFQLFPGWTHQSLSQDSDIPLYSEVTISSVTLQDYFIWTWLSSLGSDQTASVKSLFGRSIVVEAGLRGFQKWMVLTETTISPEEYISKFRSTKMETDTEHHGRSAQISPLPRNFEQNLVQCKAKASHTNTQNPLPRPPVPSKEPPVPPAPQGSPLPDVSFSNDQFSLEDSKFAHYSSPANPSPSSEFSGELSQKFSEKLVLAPKKVVRRPRPPPLDSPQKQTSEPKKDHVVSMPSSVVKSDPLDHLPSYVSEFVEFSQQGAENLESFGARVSYEEPFESYTTMYDRPAAPLSAEPFDNYQVPMKSLQSMDRPALDKELPALHVYPDNSMRYINQQHSFDAISPLVNNTHEQHSHSISNYLDERHEGQKSKANVASHQSNSVYVPPKKSSNQARPYPTEDITEALFVTKIHDSTAQSIKHPEEKEGETLDLTISNHNTEDMNRRKKKTKAKKSELKLMMANIPDGPPPPLPSFAEAIAPEIQKQSPQHSLSDTTAGHESSFGQRGDEIIQFESTNQARSGLEVSRQNYGQFISHEPHSNLQTNSAGAGSPTLHPSHSNNMRQGHERYAPRQSRENLNENAKISNLSSDHSHKSKDHIESHGRDITFGDAQMIYHHPVHHPVHHPTNDHRVVGIDQAPHEQSKHKRNGEKNHSSAQNSSHNSAVHSTVVNNALPNEAKMNVQRNDGVVNPETEYLHTKSTASATPQRASEGAIESFPSNYSIPHPIPQPMPHQVMPFQAAHPHSLPHSPATQTIAEPPVTGHFISSQATYLPPGQTSYALSGQLTSGHPVQQFYYNSVPPHGHCPPPPQAFNYTLPPAGYYPPQMASYPPQTQQQHGHSVKVQPSTSELTMMNMPAAKSYKKNSRPNKANLRAALNQGTFGI